MIVCDAKNVCSIQFLVIPCKLGLNMHVEIYTAKPNVQVLDGQYTTP